MTPQQTQLVIPLLVIVPVLALRWRRMAKARPLAWRYLWVRPLIFLLGAAILMAVTPPSLGDVPWLALGLVLGAAAGWQWGRAMAIEMHPENGTLMVKGSNLAMLVLVALILVRLGLKAGLQMEAATWHIDVALITDVFICSSVGIFSMRAMEMYLRARKVMETAPPPIAPAVARPRRWPWILGAVLAVIVIAIGALATVIWVKSGPRLHAYLCPSCAGFERVDDRIYIEKDAGAAQRRAALAAVADGNARVRAFFGDQQGYPRFFVCVTEGCYSRFRPGGSLGFQFMLNGIILSPRGIDGVIAGHEATHVDMAARVGLVGYYNSSNIPEWFKEGLAVVVAKDGRYLPPAVPDDCDVGPEDLPHTNRGWDTASGKDHMVYADAACLVRQELAANGGVKALLAAFARVRRGDPFAQAWKE